MIDYEALIEFELAIAATGPAPQLPRISLDAKLSDKITSTTSNKDITEEDLNEICKSYDWNQDCFSLCLKCGNPLTNITNFKNCCKSFTEKQNQCLASGLEKQYWLSFINNSSGTINTLPCYTQLLLLQQGIPNQLRSIIWKRLVLVGGDEIPDLLLLIFENFQHSYHPGIAKQIQKDLTRTFPLIDFFKEEETIKNLLTILNVYANYNAALGYCQGLLFLVGALYFRFRDELPAFTFHALVVIMQLEPELQNIFTADSMQRTLKNWMDQFLQILNTIDPELYHKMNAIGIEYEVFLYQWWLSFSATHIPDILIIDRVMDLCLVQGWKAGLFKVSLGLLIANKPIIMSMNEGDEEIIYQLLLNDLRWGVILKELDLFFGQTLINWDDDLFIFDSQDEESARLLFNKPQYENNSKKVPHSVMDRFIQLSVGITKSITDFAGEDTEPISATSTSSAASSSTSLSVFEPAPLEQESIFLDDKSSHSTEDSSARSSIFGFKFGGVTRNSITQEDKEKYLKELLGKALEMLEGGERNEAVLEDIKRAVIS